MPEAPLWNPFDALLGSIRAERQALRAHPQDFASIVGNRLAAQSVSWSIIDGVFRSGDRARPLLRWQGAVEAESAPATFVRDAHITACAVRWDRVVAGTDEGVLKLWSVSTGGTLGESAVTDAHSARITLVEFVGGNELVISADAGGTCHLWSPALGSPNATFEGHTSEVTAVAFHPGRGFEAAGARDGSVRMWHRDADRAFLALVGHTAPVTALDFAPEGQYLVSASRDGTLRLWETRSGRCLGTMRGHAADVIACAFVPTSETGVGDARILSASTDGLVKLWTSEGRIAATLGGHEGPIRDMRMVPSRPGSPTAAVTASDDGTVRVWNLQTEREERVLRGHGAPVLQAAPYGLGPRRILSVAADGGCRIWEADTGGVLREFAIGGTSSAQLSVARDGNLAACVMEDGGLARIDLDATMEPPPSRVALDSTGARLLIGSGSRVRVREWRMPAAFTENQELPDTQTVIAALWMGSSYVTLHADGTLAYWLRDGKRYTEQPFPARTPPGQTTAIASSPDGSVLVAGDARGDAVSWRREGDRVIARATIAPARAKVNACACALNGHALAAGDDGTLRLWDTTTGAVLQDIAAHAVPILGCDISHDGSMALSAAADGTLRMWDAGGRMQRHVAAHTDAITGCWIGSITNRAITCSRDRTVKLWDLESGTCLETFYGDAPFVSLAVAPAGPIAAAADTSGRVTVLHVLEGFGDARQTAA